MSNSNYTDINFDYFIEKPQPPPLFEPMEFFEPEENALLDLSPPPSSEAVPTRITEPQGISSPQTRLPSPLVEEASSVMVDLEKIMKTCDYFELTKKGGKRQSRKGEDFSSGKITAYIVMQKFLANTILRTKERQVYVYTGTHYAPYTQNEIEKMIVNICRDEISTVGSCSLPKDVFEFLLMEPEIAVVDDPYNANCLAFQNGLLDVSSGKLYAHSPQVFTTYALECVYPVDPAYTMCPRFDRFLAEVTGGDVALVQRIWQIIGYCLSPDTTGKVLFVFQGVPSSGKSKLCELIGSFFPSSKVSSLDVHALKSQFAMCELEDKAICLSPDLPCGPLDVISVSNLKKLTGDDLVSADKKYASRRQFRFRGKIIMATNYPLLVTKRDEAFFERVVAVPFLYSVPPEHRQRNLIDELKSERSAIAGKAMLAYFGLRHSNYRFSGNYALNEGLSFCDDVGATGGDMVTNVFVFARQHTAPCANGIVFMDDAHARFSSIYGDIPFNTFSTHFTMITNELYGAKHIRKRKAGAVNPTSSLANICLK